MSTPTEAEHMLELKIKSLADWWDYSDQERECYRWGFIAGYEAAQSLHALSNPPGKAVCEHGNGPACAECASQPTGDV